MNFFKIILYLNVCVLGYVQFVESVDENGSYHLVVNTTRPWWWRTTVTHPTIPIREINIAKNTEPDYINFYRPTTTIPYWRTPITNTPITNFPQRVQNAYEVLNILNEAANRLKNEYRNFLNSDQLDTLYESNRPYLGTVDQSINRIQSNINLPQVDVNVPSTVAIGHNGEDYDNSDNSDESRLIKILIKIPKNSEQNGC